MCADTNVTSGGDASLNHTRHVLTIEISKWAKIAAEAVRTINPSIAPEEWIQVAINDACQEKDTRIAILERNLEDARAARDVLLQDKFGTEVQLKLLDKGKRIAELSEILERVPHLYNDIKCSLLQRSDRCPRCAYERLKAS